MKNNKRDPEHITNHWWDLRDTAKDLDVPVSTVIFVREHLKTNNRDKVTSYIKNRSRYYVKELETFPANIKKYPVHPDATVYSKDGKIFEYPKRRPLDKSRTGFKVEEDGSIKADIINAKGLDNDIDKGDMPKQNQSLYKESNLIIEVEEIQTFLEAVIRKPKKFRITVDSYGNVSSHYYHGLTGIATHSRCIVKIIK